MYLKSAPETGDTPPQLLDVGGPLAKLFYCKNRSFFWNRRWTGMRRFKRFVSWFWLCLRDMFFLDLLYLCFHEDLAKLCILVASQMTGMDSFQSMERRLGDDDDLELMNCEEYEWISVISFMKLNNVPNMLAVLNLSQFSPATLIPTG